MTEQNPNERDEPIIRDKRRIDPETGKVREPSQDSAAEPVEERETISDEDLASLLNEAMGASAASDSPEGDEESLAGNTGKAAEHLEDLRRVQAEYANYRRRTEREKAELTDVAVANVVTQLLPVIDDFGLASEAGDLPEGSALQVIVAKFLGTLEKMGVEPYGEQGEAFDPVIHEAIAQIPNAEVTEQVIADVVQLGYRIGEREIRPAKVAVFVPAE